MSFDIDASIRHVTNGLKAEGLHEYAARIEEAIQTASTGTEILCNVGVILRGMKKSTATMSDALRRECAHVEKIIRKEFKRIP